MHYFGSLFSDPWTPPGTGISISSVLLFVVVAWSIVWKGLALWRAARMGSKVWFVVLLVLNTLGILEILYLYVFSKKKMSATSMPVEERKN
jgi:uncharacterized membrane protein YagU involved in acid resistance